MNSVAKFTLFILPTKFIYMFNNIFLADMVRSLINVNLSVVYQSANLSHKRSKRAEILIIVKIDRVPIYRRQKRHR